MARAATSQELAYIRSDNQKSELRMCIYTPSNLVTARVGTAPSSNDVVQAIDLTGVSGALSGVQDGMTVLIGTGAGLSDVGVVRAISASGSTMQIGRTSDVGWVTGQYVTVLPEWMIWARQLAFSGGVWNIEGDIPYTNQNQLMDPMVNMGPIAAVKILAPGSTVTYTPTAAASWYPGGSSLAAIVWAAPGASATSGMTTTTPTITYNAVGQYRIDCTITTTEGKSSTGHRYVFVVGDDDTGALTQFEVKSLAGDIAAGGWTFDATVYEGATQATVRNGAFVVVWARDWYGDTEINIGTVPGYENIVCCGWIDGETVHWNPEQGNVQFKVLGPAQWMAKVSSWPISVTDSNGPYAAGSSWMVFDALTVDKAVWHLTHWRSTVDKICDVIPSGDTRRCFDCSANAGNLWDQLKSFSDTKIVATPGCDHYGRLVVQVDPQVLPVGDRAALPVVMALSKVDWMDSIDIPYKNPTGALLEGGGFCYLNGAWTPMLARASGNAMGRLGAGLTSRYNFQFTDQAGANVLTAAWYAKTNNLYPSVTVDLAQNNRLIDIVPQQYVTLSVAAGDTPRGITWVNKRGIPRRVEWKYQQGGMILTSLDIEIETVPGQAVTVLPPADGLENKAPSTTPYKWNPYTSPVANNHPTVVPRINPPGTIVAPPGLPVVCSDAANGPFQLYVNDIITNSRKKSIYVTFTNGNTALARIGSFTNQTVLVLQCDFQNFTAGVWVTDPAGAFAEAYLCNEFGARLYQGVWSGTGTQRTVTFAPPAPTRFSSVEICLDAYSVFNVASVSTAYDGSAGQFGGYHLTHSDSWSVGADGGLHVHVDAAITVDNAGGGGYIQFMSTDTTIDAPDVVCEVNTNYDVYAIMTLFASDDNYDWCYHALQSWRTGDWSGISLPVGQWRNYLKEMVTVMNGPLDPATQSPAYRQRTNPRPGDLTINHPAPYSVWKYGGSGLRIGSVMSKAVPVNGTWRYFLDYTIYGQANRRLIVSSGQFYNLCA